MEYLLVRIPMLSEAEEVAAYADISLQSELSVIRAVNDACGKFGTHHDVILMLISETFAKASGTGANWSKQLSVSKTRLITSIFKVWERISAATAP